MSPRNTSAAPTGDACIIPKGQTFLGIDAPFFSSIVVSKAKSRRKPVQPRMLDPETHWKVVRRPPTNQRGNQPAIPCRKTRVGEAIDAGGGNPEPGAFRATRRRFEWSQWSLGPSHSKSWDLKRKWPSRITFCVGFPKPINGPKVECAWNWARTKMSTTKPGDPLIRPCPFVETSNFVHGSYLKTRLLHQ